MLSSRCRPGAGWSIGLAATAALGASGAAPATVDVEPPVSHGIGTFPTDAIAIDLTGDDLAEIVTANMISSDLSVLVNLGDGTFANQLTLAVGAGMPLELAAGDLDGDGDRDVVVSVLDGAGAMAVMINTDGVLAPIGMREPAQTATVLINATPPPPPGDTNFDGVVDGDDLVNVILLWNTAGLSLPGVVADLDGSGVVDSDDLVQVILSWDAI